MIDAAIGERHRADVLHQLPGRQGTIIELQHSPISEKERDQRKRFTLLEGECFG